MQATRERHVLEAENRLPIRLTISRAQQFDRPLPVVTVLHGFKGFQDWGFFPHLLAEIARHGFLAVGVDFSKNGIGDEPGEFTRLDLFADNCLSDEIDDLRRVFAYLEGRDDADLSRAGLLGHSRGGSTAILAAHRGLPVHAVATWAAVANWENRLTPAQWHDWERQGFLEVLNARTGQVMKTGDRLRREQRSVEWNPGRAAADLAIPLLLVHGRQDEAVPVTDAELLASVRKEGSTELRIIEGAGHTFGAVHPFAGSTPELDEAIDASVAFFTRQLLSGLSG